MPLSNSKLPVLSLLPSLEPEATHVYPAEREVDRNALLDVAPDRESLLTSGQSVEEVRRALKMRIPITTGHWLYNTQKRQEVKLREATTRLSVFGQPAVTTPDGISISADANPRIRRVLSTSSIYTFSGATMTSIENRLNSSTNGSNRPPIEPRLSTPEKLISPRPPGLTHILVVYATMPNYPTVPPVDPQGTSPRRKKKGVTYPEVIELPINDLVFILNVPNLAPSAPAVPLLPRRLHKELPRVLMYVPHLDTFPELVIFLHTKNQAELFRKIIPEWIRDLIYPLPMPLPPTYQLNPAPLIPSGGAPAEGRGMIKFLGLLVSGSSSTTSINTTSINTTSSSFSATSTPPPEPDRTLKAISEEIAEVFSTFSLTEEEDPLLQTAARLDALRDNLCHIGYFNHTLWNELDIYHDIVLMSISLKARLEME